MTIIFDSEEEKQDFIDRLCPHNLGIDDSIKICDIYSCNACWEGSGIEMEVKESKDGSE